MEVVGILVGGLKLDSNLGYVPTTAVFFSNKCLVLAVQLAHFLKEDEALCLFLSFLRNLELQEVLNIR